MDIDKDQGIDRFVQQRRVSAAEASGTPVTELQTREATARSLGMSTDELRLIPTQLQNRRPWEVSFDEFSAHIGPRPHEGIPYQELSNDPVKSEDIIRWSEKRRPLNAIWERSVAEAVSEGRLPLDDPRALSVSSLSRYGQEMKPLPERLWHVTTAGDAIEEVGPKTRAQLGMTLGGTGLGSGPDDTISFTDDFDIAKNIKRAMIEARKVASGEITIADMLDMARRGEGAKKPFYDSLTRVTSEDVLERLARGYTRSDRGLGKLVSEVPSNWIPINPQRNSRGETFAFSFERPMSPSEIRHQRFEIYKQLSFVRESAGGPENPLFMSTDVAKFAGTPEDQIRIIEYEPRPGAKGYQVSALGEWRTYSGNAVSSRGEVGINIGRPRAAAPEAPRAAAMAAYPEYWKMSRADFDAEADRSYKADVEGTRQYTAAIANEFDDLPRAMQQYATDFNFERPDLVRRLRNVQPNDTVTIYRAISADDPAAGIRPGDWVALDRSYTEMHGSSGYGDVGSRIVEMEVPAREVIWAGTSADEWHYAPEASRNSAVKSKHEAIVRQAVREGKPVPASVLSEYPDLVRAAAPEAPRTGRPKRGGQGTVGTIGGIAGLGISGALAAQAARGTVPEEVRESGVEAFYRFKGGKPVEARELDPKSKAVQAFVENEEALQWALQNNRISEDAYKQLSSLRK